MSKKAFIFVVVGISVLVGIGIIVSSFIQPSSSSHQAVVSPSPVVQDANGNIINTQSSSVVYPEDVVKQFFTWYISYSGNPLTSGAYKKNGFLTPTYKDIITGFISGSPSSDYDPVFCPANKTKNPAVESAVYNDTGNMATVIIHDGDIDGGKSLYKVTLKYIGNKWLIDDIICLP